MFAAPLVEKSYRLDELLGWIAASSSGLAFRKGVDADDLTQTVTENLLRALKKHEIDLASMGPEESVILPYASPQAYIRTLAKNAAVAALSAIKTGRASQHDRAAIRLLAMKEDAFRRTHHRFWTSSEKAAAAEQVRAEQPSAARATQGYQNFRAPMSFEALLETASLARFQPVIASHTKSTVRDIDRDHFGQHGRAALAAIVDVGHEVGFAAARLHAWNLAAEAEGQLVFVEAGCLSETEAAAARRVVANEGGALAVARRYTGGDLPSEQEEALFAPFGPGLDRSGEQVVARLIIRYDRIGDELWDAAVAACTQQRRAWSDIDFGIPEGI